MAVKEADEDDILDDDADDDVNDAASTVSNSSAKKTKHVVGSDHGRSSQHQQMTLTGQKKAKSVGERNHLNRLPMVDLF